ncbi:RNA-binding transcriptional accessory protein [Myxococcota bacterium]|nr:RNA-binding transcriptional accessory protein [Myxococcota bacterium]MBU1430668.1 RNA-binding transcriptional accessory protein [Myxococcota bacterium]MBU1896403.1 RNA-binding transcriptional accessory protein [Myxococcota bacterium]
MHAHDLTPQIAADLQLPQAGVGHVIALISEGNTVPFIARYRKEATGGLDEVQIRDIQARHEQLTTLNARREVIRAAIAEQGKLTEALSRGLDRSQTLAALEDLYLPYKKKRRTRASAAVELGLEPLAQAILAQPRGGDLPGHIAAHLAALEAPLSAEEALAGARDIIAERVAEHPQVRAMTRAALRGEGLMRAKAKKKPEIPEEEIARFAQYADHAEAAARIPPHRYLALCRGEQVGALRVSVELPAEHLLAHIYRIFGVDAASPLAPPLTEAIDDGYKRLLSKSAEGEVRRQLKAEADTASIEVFAQNLKALLLAAPFGARAVLGVDPGLRTGCKCAALSATGRFLAHRTIYLVGSEAQRDAARRDLLALIEAHAPEAVAVGNGTGGREAAQFIREVLDKAGRRDLWVVPVNEAGASVYSASDIAREEFPELDLTIRGAISIGRRLQDPLAELVKIDPKSIGVGQYQHDVDQPQLKRKLDEVIEDCVNRVGVNLNTASGALLAHVAGLGPATAQKIIAHRDAAGGFTARRQLLKVPGLGPKTFQQCAGFLRLPGAEHPLDASAVHPERYAVVERMAADLGAPLEALIGDARRVGQINPGRYASAELGLLTLADILEELKKPGRDPRPPLEPPRHRADVNTMEDLKEGMILEGVITNVTHFGAFVDVGVHQDGLVHISQLADRFVRDPHEVAAPGQRLKVRVISVDLKHKRIGLSAKGLSQ